MKCNNIHRNLIFYLEGDLTREKREEIKSHLHECEVCRNFAANLTSALEIIEKEKRPQMNSFLYTRIQEKINNYDYNSNAVITSAAKLLRPVLILIVVVFGIFAGIKLGTYFDSKYVSNVPELQIEAYYLNDLQHESVETALLSEDFETENIN